MTLMEESSTSTTMIITEVDNLESYHEGACYDDGNYDTTIKMTKILAMMMTKIYRILDL